MLDSMVATTFANVAMDLIRDGIGGRMVAIRDGKYAHVSLAETGKPPRRVQLDAYDTERFRPKYADRLGRPAAADAVAGAGRRLSGSGARPPASRPGPDSARIARARFDMSSSPWPRATRPDSSCAARPATGQRRADRARQLEGDREVLEVERGPEPERVLVVDHPAAAVLEHPAARRAAAERRRRRPPGRGRP